MDYIQQLISDGITPEFASDSLPPVPHLQPVTFNAPTVVPPAPEVSEDPFSDMKAAFSTPDASAITQIRRFPGDISRFQNSGNYSTFGYNPDLPYVKSGETSYDPNEVRYQQAQTFGDVMKAGMGQFAGLAWNSFKGSAASDGNFLNAMFNWGSDLSFKERLIGTSEELLKDDMQQKAIMNKYPIFQSPATEGVLNKEFLGTQLGQLGFTVGTGAYVAAETLLTMGIADALLPVSKSSLLARAGRGLEAAGSAAERAQFVEFAEMARKNNMNAQAIIDLKRMTDLDRSFMESLWTGMKNMVPGYEAYGNFTAARNAGATLKEGLTAGLPGLIKSYTMFNAARAEATMEAGSTYGQLYMDLINQWENSHGGQSPIGEDLERIKNTAYGAATDNYIVNTGLLSVMNEIEFGNMMTNFSSTKRLFREAAENGTKDLYTVTGKLKSGEVGTRVFASSRYGALGNFNNIRKEFGLGTALWGATKQLAKNSGKLEISEGLQEILQETSNNTFRDYYTNLYNGNKNIDGSQLLNITAEDWSKGLGTQLNAEGWKTFLMGATTGLFLSPLTASTMYAKDKVAQRTNPQYRQQVIDNKKELNENIQTLNAFYSGAKDKFLQHIANTKTQMAASKGMQESLPEDDRYTFYNHKNDALAAAAAVAIKTGNIESFLDTIKELGNGKLTDQEFAQAMGIQDTDGQPVSARAYTQQVADDIQQYYTNWQNLKDRYADLVIPQMYTDPLQYKIASEQKAALNDAIELLATTSYHANKTLERAAQIQAEMAKLPDIGSSVNQAFEHLSSIDRTVSEIRRLQEQAKAMEGLNDPETNKMRNGYLALIGHLQAWKDSYELYNKHLAQYMEGKGSELENTDGTPGEATKNVQKLMDLFKAYVEAHNRQNSTSPKIIRQESLDKAFRGLSDMIALNRDHGHYVEALNVLSDPYNFQRAYNRILDGQQTATINNYTEAKKETKERAKGQETPTQATTVESTIENFVERMKKGEKLSTPEDLQFYENNKEAIESLLRTSSSQPINYNRLRDEFIEVYLNEDEQIDAELSNEGIQYLKDHKDFADKLQSIQELYYQDIPTMSRLIRSAIDEEFNHQPAKSYDNLEGQPHVAQVGTRYQIVDKGKPLAGTYPNTAEANKALDEYVDKNYPLFNVQGKEYRVRQYLWDNEGKRTFIGSYKNGKIYVGGQQVTEQELLDYHTEPFTPEVVLQPETDYKSKITRLHDQVRIYPIQDRSLYQKLPVQPIDGKFQIIDTRREGNPVLGTYDTKVEADDAVKDYIMRAAAYTLDNKLRSIPRNSFYDGLSLSIARGPAADSAPIPLGDNPHVVQNREQYTLQLSYNGQPLGFIPTPGLYSFTFDGKSVSVPAMTVDQFKKVFNVEGRNAQEALTIFQNDYTKAQQLSDIIQSLVAADINQVSGQTLKDILNITVSPGSYDFLNGPQAVNRPIVEQVAAKNDILAVVANNTGETIYGSTEGITEPKENSVLGNYRAAVRIPNGDVHWIELQARVFDKEELDGITSSIEQLSQKIKSSKTGKDNKLAKEGTDILSQVFITQDPVKKVSFTLRLKNNGDIQVGYILSDNTSGNIVINAGKGNESTPLNFHGNSEELFKRIEREINHRFKKDKNKFPQDIVIGPANIRKQFGKNPTTAEIMGLQATVSPNITKGYYLIYTPNISAIPQEIVPVINEDIQSDNIQGGQPEEIVDPATIVPTTLESLGALSQMSDQFIAEQSGGDPNGILDMLLGGDMPAMKVVPSIGFSPYSVASIEQFNDWVTANLPENITVEDLGVLQQNLINNRVTVGQFLIQLGDLKPTGGVIKVYQNSPFKYHEAFHAVFRLLLTQPKIDQLLDIARREHPPTQKMLDTFRDLHPQYSTLTDNQLEQLYLEEYMADKFDKWISDKKVQTSHTIKSFFAKIIDWIKGVWDHITGNHLQSLFYDINKGKYQNSRLQDNQFTTNEFIVTDPAMKVIEVGTQQITDNNGRTLTIPRYLPQQEGNQLACTIAALFQQQTQLQPQASKNTILDGILDQYKDLLYPRQQRYIDYANSIRNTTTRVQWLRKLSDKWKVFNNEGSRRSVKEAVDAHLRIMGYKQELEDNGWEEIEDTYGNNSQNYDKAADSIGGYGSLARYLREYIGSTTVPIEHDEFGNSAFLDGTPLVQAVNANNIYNGLLKILTNTTDENKLIDRLLLYKDSNNQDTAAFINRIFEETGFQRDDTGNWEVTKNPILLQQVIKAFNQFTTNPLFAEIDPSKGTSIVYAANRKDSGQVQIDQWAQSYDSIYIPGVSVFAEKGQQRAKKEYINRQFKGFADIKEPIRNNEQTTKAISDERLRALAQESSNLMKSRLGINLHPLYLEYSVAYGKNRDVRTERQQRLVNGYGNTYPLSVQDIDIIHSILLKGDSLFSKDIEGAAALLTRIAAANSLFDETVATMSYIGADGETRYGHQYPNYHYIAVQELNDADHIAELRNSPDHQSFLLNSDNFIELSAQGKLKVENIDGLKQRFHIVTNESDSEGEPVVYSSQGIEVNREDGVAYGDFNEREFEAFLLTMYGADGGKVQGSDVFYTTPHLIRVLEAKGTGHMTRLPVIESVYQDKSGKTRLSDTALDIMYNMVSQEYDRIKRVQREIVTLPQEQLITDYHTGALRGLKLYNTRSMMGILASVIENAAKGLDKDDKPLEQEYKLSEVAVKAQIKRYWATQVDNYIDQLASLGLINKKGKEITNNLLPGYLFKGFNSDIRNEKMNIVPGNFYHNISQVFMNDYLNTVGLIQILYGDEAKAFKNPVDQVKRAAGANASGPSMAFSITAPDLGIEHPLEIFHHVTFADPKFTKMTGEQGDKADAQMYGTRKGIQYALFGFGKLTKVQADILEKLEQGKTITEKDFFGAGGLKEHGAFSSMKLVYFDGNVYLKNSMMPLFKEFTSYKDTHGIWRAYPGREHLHTLREKMEAFERENDTVVFGHPVTASKALKEGIAENIDAIDGRHFKSREARWMRLQQENPSNKLSITDPTQAKIQILAEQEDNTLVHYLGVDTTIGNVKKAYKEDTARRVANNYRQVANIVFNLENSTIEVHKSIAEGKITPTLGKFFDIMRETLEATGSDAQTLAFLETQNGQPVYDLNFPSTLTKFTQIFLNYFSKGVLSEKEPGLTLSLVSDYGIQKVKKVLEVDNITGQPKRWQVITDREYRKNPSKYQYKTYTDPVNRLFADLKVGDYILADLAHNYEEYDDKGNSLGFFSEYIRPAHYVEEMSGVQQDLSTGFGVRIPSDDKHSYITLKMVDTAPVAYGSIGIFPQELLEISGADFDIDKEYIHIPDTYRKQVDSHNGNPIYGRVAYGTAQTPEEQFEEYITYQFENNKLVKSTIRNMKSNQVQGIVSDILGTNRTVLIAALKELGLPSNTQEFMDKGGPELNNGVLNNRILASKITLLNNSHISGGGNKAIINQGTSTDSLTNLVKELKDIFSGMEGEGVKNILSILTEEDVDINTLAGKSIAFRNNKEGQRNIGAAINSMLAFSLLQQYNVEGFADTLTSDGQRKFAQISAIVNAMTDNAKERLAAKLGLNIEAVGLAAAMVAQGYSLKDSVLYMLQPSVREYFAKLKTVEGTLRTPQEKSTVKSYILQNLIAEYKDTEPIILDQQGLIDNIATGGINKGAQLVALLTIQEQKRIVDTLNNINKVIGMSKGLPATWEDVDGITNALKELGIQNGKADDQLPLTAAIDVRNILTTDPIYSTYIDILGQINTLGKEVFLERTPLFKRIIGMVQSNLSVRRGQQDDFNKNLKLDLISYLSITAYRNWLNKNGMAGTLSTLDHAMIYDTAAQQKGPDFENIVQVIERLRNTLKGKRQNYLISKFLRTLSAAQDTNKDRINKAESNTWARLSEQQQQRLQDSFVDLYSNPKTHDDAVALFNYLLVKDGGQFRSGSYIRFIPVFAFKDLLDNTRTVNQLLAREDYNEQDAIDIFGIPYNQVLNDFMISYSTHIGNQFFVPTVAQPTVPGTIVDDTANVDWNKVKAHISSVGDKPVAIDTRKGYIAVNLFKGIREYQGKVDSDGIRIVQPTGKLDNTEKKLLAKNISYIQAAGFKVESEDGIRIQFPYSIKTAGQLYVLKSIDKHSGEPTPTRLIEKGENMPQGIRAIYEKENWRGSKAQWKGAGVFGPIPEAVALPTNTRVDNPGYAPTVPDNKEVTETIDTKAPYTEQGQTPIQQLNSMGYYALVDNTGRTVIYNSENNPVGTSRSASAIQDYLDYLASKTEETVVPSQPDILSSLGQLSQQNIVSEQDIDDQLTECYG